MNPVATKPEVFSLCVPLLSKGRQDTWLAQSDLLRLSMKVYAEGGENVLHAHTAEDHAFIVMQGQARFHDRDDNVTVVGPYEGIFLPKQTYYRFENCGEGSLVMLRVGAAAEHPATTRYGVDGQPLPGYSKENKHEDGVPIEGAFFGAR